MTFFSSNVNSVNDCKTGCITNEIENDFWEEENLKLKTMENNFKRFSNHLVATIESASDYLEEYVRSTQLTSSFYE